MRPLRVFLSALGVLLLGGCAGYQLGPTNGLNAGSKAVRIIPFSNQTLEPRLGDAVTIALRKDLQRDGTYRLATPNGGDIVVSGVLTRYNRRELSFVPRDVLTVRDYRVTLTAEVIARDVTTGKARTNLVTGYTLVRFNSDLTSAERQALPLLAEDLAKNVTEWLVDGTW